MPGIDDRRKIIQISLAENALPPPLSFEPPRASSTAHSLRARTYVRAYVHTCVHECTRVCVCVSIVVRRVTSYTMACDLHGKRNLGLARARARVVSSPCCFYSARREPSGAEPPRALTARVCLLRLRLTEWI